MSVDPKKMPYAARRREMKARVLMAASLVIEEANNWEVLDEKAEELGLPEDALQSVVNEVAAELWKRSVRLS